MIRKILEELNSPRLFVYGTLMKNRSGHDQMKGAVFLGTVSTKPSYTVRNLSGGGIGVAPGGNSTVSGELYQVTGKHLRRLDTYEKREFRRSTVTLSDDSKAYAYLLK